MNIPRQPLCFSFKIPANDNFMQCKKTGLTYKFERFCDAVELKIFKILERL